MKIKFNDKFKAYLIAHKIKIGNFDGKHKKRKGAKASSSKIIKKNYLYYGMLACMVVISIASVTLAVKTYGKFGKENYDYYDNGDTTVGSSNIASSKDQVSINDNASTSASASAPSVIDKGYEKPIDSNIANSSNIASGSSSTKPSEEKKVTVPTLSFVKPVAGEIIKPYSPDAVVFWPTLNTWKTHEGMDIKADKRNCSKSYRSGYSREYKK